MTFQQGDAGALPYRSRFFGRSVEIRSAVHSTADMHPGTATVHWTVAIAARLAFSNLNTNKNHSHAMRKDIFVITQHYRFLKFAFKKRRMTARKT